MDVSNPSYTVNVSASDDIGIHQVQVLIDGVVVATDYTYPYEVIVPSSSLNGKFSAKLTVVATDIGQKAVSSEELVIAPSAFTTTANPTTAAPTTAAVTTGAATTAAATTATVTLTTAGAQSTAVALTGT